MKKFYCIIPGSVRGIGSGVEAGIMALKEKDNELYRTILDMIRSSASDAAVIESGGHAIYIGRKG